MTKDNLPKGFLLYKSYEEQFEMLNDEDLGQLVRALMKNFNHGDEPEFEGSLAMAYSFMRSQIERDTLEYSDMIEKRRAGGNKGGRPKKNSGDSGPESNSPDEENVLTNENHKVSEKPQGFSENHKVSEKPNKKEKEKEKEKEKAIAIEKEKEKEMPAAAAAFENEIEEYEREKDFKRVVDAFTKNLAGLYLSSAKAEKLEAFLDYGMEADVLIEAAERTGGKPSPSWDYAMGILKKWVHSGVMTMEDVKVEDAAFERKKAAAFAEKEKARGKPNPQANASSSAPLYDPGPEFSGCIPRDVDISDWKPGKGVSS
jgi:DnaD/phage-associated family protein